MKTDNTAALRQNKRIKRLASEGLYRKSTLVHEECMKVFEEIKPYFANPRNLDDLWDLAQKLKKLQPVNVASVKQLSPFRYPGGKTWFVPELRNWIHNLGYRPRLFIEPFAGGGIGALTVATEDLAERVLMVELDPEVASVWKTILNEPEYLCKKILKFSVTLEHVREILSSDPQSIPELAFKTIVKNRMQRGGILAPGASLIKSGENGKGLLSRWYPQTLVKRIRIIHQYRDKIDFREDDGFKVLKQHLNDPETAIFIDPPYTASKKNAGKRLYKYNSINHTELFELLSRCNGQFLMTYDDADEVIALANKFNFVICKVPMKSSHHQIKYELAIKRTD